MCSIENFTFVINSSNPYSLSCNGKIGDKIEIESIVRIDAIDIVYPPDPPVYFKPGVVVIFPDSTVHEFFTPEYLIYVQETKSFIVDISTVITQPGVYIIDSVNVYDYTTGISKCYSNFSSNGCVSLIVSEPCSVPSIITNIT